jgi:hypothetical protein
MGVNHAGLKLMMARASCFNDLQGLKSICELLPATSVCAYLDMLQHKTRLLSILRL